MQNYQISPGNIEGVSFATPPPRDGNRTEHTEFEPYFGLSEPIETNEPNVIS